MDQKDHQLKKTKVVFEKDFYKRVNSEECYNCGIRYFSKLAYCPRCKTKNRDQKDGIKRFLHEN